MSDKAIRDELTKLKEQVAELQSARSRALSPQERQAPNTATENPAMSGAEESNEDIVSSEDKVEKDAEEQIRDFVNALALEIKSTNPMTALVVFSLGVLIGRLLPR